MEKDGKDVHDVGDFGKVWLLRVDVLTVDVTEIIVGFVGKLCEKVSEEHDDLTIVAPGHERGSGGVTWGRGSGATAKEFVGGHGEEDVLVVASAQVQHGTRGIEPEHGVLPLERNEGFVKVQVEGEAMCGLGVRKEGGQTDAVRDGEMVVDHGLFGLEDDATGT